MRYQGPDHRRAEEDDSDLDEKSAEEISKAEADFCGAMTGAGFPQGTIDQLAALGPVLCHRKWEADQLRFASPEKEAAFAKALNAWGKASF